ncbi:MAG: hypothetical protein K2M48_03120 [Clostridiales bacterium]|nr:hypothetical protein [Clostridiales bacterium]
MKDKVTGMQLLSEFETLLIDTGIYMVSVGKRIFGYLKKSIENAKAERDSDKESAAPVGEKQTVEAAAA